MAAPSELWNKLIEIDSAGGTLSDEARTILRVNKLACDLDHGGLSGWLYDVSPVDWSRRWLELRAVVLALGHVGLPELAGALTGLADVLEARAPRGSSSWGEVLEGAEVKASISEVEASLAAADEALWATLERFTVEASRTGRLTPEERA